MSHLIEIYGTGTANKGAELMLIAVLEHLKSLGRGVEGVVSPWFGGFSERAAYGLRCKLTNYRFGRSWLATKLMPAGFRRAHGFVLESEVDAVIDASGFAFSDQFGPSPTERFAAAVKAWKQQGKKIVMLPQALGPFTGEPIQAAFRTVLRNVDLVFARDLQSLAHVRGLGGRQEHVRLAPDFTNLLEPELVDGQAGRVCIVPNARMLEKGDEAARGRYLPFVAASVKLVRQRGLVPVMLLHESKADEPLVAPLQALLAAPMEVIRESNPRRLKGIIGSSHLVIGSRFHALVSALSQGVPAIAAGWSHKYVELFRDYGWDDGVVALDINEQQLGEMIDRCVVEPSRRMMISGLKHNAERQKETVREMWREVDSVLGLQVTTGITSTQ